MSIRKMNIVRILNGYISRNITSTQEIADIIEKGQRTVQFYLDLSDEREFKASDISRLSVHFARMGYMELAYQFLPTNKCIKPLRIGQAVGDTRRLTHEIARINGRLAEGKRDPEELKQLQAQLEDVLSDLGAETALLASRMNCREDE
jgi:hypothetical protein